MEMKLMTTLAIFTALIAPAIADHTTRAFSNSSVGGFSLPLFAKQSPDHTIRRGTDGFLYLQHTHLIASAANTTTTPIRPAQHPHCTSVHFGTGIGKHEYILELDATAMMTWIQCVPCAPVATQTGPLFDPDLSPSFQHVSNKVCTPPFIPDPATQRCLFHVTRLPGLSVKGFVSVDEYTREDGHVIPRFFFGCAHETYNFDNINTYAGVLAFREFATQAAAARGLTRSSYCLFRDTNRRGFIRFGAEADVPHRPHYQTTRLLPPAAAAHGAHESAYHVSLAGVSLGGRRLDGVRPETFAHREDGQGECIVDLGTPLTVMVEAVWSDLERHGAERVQQAAYGFCVRATEVIKGRLLPMSLHFAREEEEEATLMISPKQLFLMMDDGHYQNDQHLHRVGKLFSTGFPTRCN